MTVVPATIRVPLLVMAANVSARFSISAITPALIVSAEPEPVPLIVSTLEPGPWIVIFAVKFGSALARLIVPDIPVANDSVCVPPAALASRIACRRLPSPESFRLNTAGMTITLTALVTLLPTELVIVTRKLYVPILLNVTVLFLAAFVPLALKITEAGPVTDQVYVRT